MHFIIRETFSELGRLGEDKFHSRRRTFDNIYENNETKDEVKYIYGKKKRRGLLSARGSCLSVSKKEIA